MPGDDAPVDPDEYVYRRIAPGFFSPATDPTVRAETFRPSDQDTAGLSVFRERFTGPEAARASITDPARRAACRVARLAVRDLAALGLSVVAGPVPDLPGHAVIPELNTGVYHAAKKSWLPILLQLAALAAADIVLAPPP